MVESNSDFKSRIYSIVAKIPQGKLMTYGQIATFCGHPNAAWQVGQIAHFGPTDLPWHRVVNKSGGLAKGWPGGGREAHRALLLAENIDVSDNFIVDITTIRWTPSA